AAMRAAAKVAGTGVINHGFRGFPAVPTAEHPFTSTARKATRPVTSICSSSDTSIAASVLVQKPCWEIDDWEFAGGEDGV
ncbi:hypothetical protein, partial [Klebsiella pneumoniae]|uniref:hypothetical protein n=1 Tax=Klebsiella pneumoniae TaxID=573 RepID=UPI0030132894